MHDASLLSSSEDNNEGRAVVLVHDLTERSRVLCDSMGKTRTHARGVSRLDIQCQLRIFDDRFGGEGGEGPA